MVEEAVLIAGWAITRRNGERFLENGDRFGENAHRFPLATAVSTLG